MSKRQANQAEIDANTKDGAQLDDQAIKKPKLKFTITLVFDGNCNQAIDYYAEVFKGKVVERWPCSCDPTMSEDWKDKIKHAVIEFDTATLFLCDRNKDESWIAGSNTLISTAFDATTDADATFQALAADGTVQVAFAKQFWVSMVFPI
jgi:PhnB protein